MASTRTRQADPPALSDTAERLHAAAIQLLRSVRVEDRASGLSGPRLSALSVIVFGGPLPMSALAAAEQVKPPTISRMVAELEREGLVERVRETGDRRVLKVRATASGRKLLEEGRRRRVARIAKALEGLAPEDRKLLARAADLLDQVVRPSPASPKSSPSSPAS